jgi:hypothetical protein
MDSEYPHEARQSAGPFSFQLSTPIIMAIKLIANYSKRLGLPGFSSHQFSVSVETELVATDDIPGESERLYQLLQYNVDEQMLSTGFVPPADYGMEETSPPANGRPPVNGSASAAWQRGPAWRCSDKQRDLILKIVDEYHLDKASIEVLANERFGKGVKSLNKMEASGLIDELLDTHGSTQQQQPPANGHRRTQGSAYANGRRNR